jgi:hypothetical protein
MSQEILDEWQIILEQKKYMLENCQKEQHLKSCMLCPKLLDCQTRDQYIKAVYDSMSKGQGGGFEF